jgi:hypothetical protein
LLAFRFPADAGAGAKKAAEPTRFLDDAADNPNITAPLLRQDMLA